MKEIKLKTGSNYGVINKIVCVGRNYADHAKELGNEIPEKPVLFLKPASAVIYSGEKIIHPSFSNEMHHECELILLIGNDIKNCNKEEAENSIAGYGIGLDMTLRDVQNELKKKGNPWTLAKCFDTSAVISDFILKEEYLLNGNEKLILNVNGETKQNESIYRMIFNPVELVVYISSVMKLEKGDLIFTGTPAGVSKVNIGDKLEAKFDNILTLETEVISE